MSLILTARSSLDLQALGMADATPLSQGACERALAEARCLAGEVNMVRAATKCGDLDVLVARRSDNRRLGGVRIHTHALALPAGSLMRIHPALGLDADIFLTAPSLSYQQLAARTPFPLIVLLGLELLGSYHGSANTESGCLYGITPITGLEDLRQGLKALERAFEVHRAASAGEVHVPAGLGACLRALPWLKEGAASPMEAAIYALLCLPVRLGGYGLPMPELNAPILLDDRQARLTGTHEIRFDFLWREAALAVEYDSDAYHVDGVSREKVLRDKRRINAAKLAGIDVITITRDTLMKLNGFHFIAIEIAKRLGKRLRPLSASSLAARGRLREFAIYGRRL